MEKNQLVPASVGLVTNGGYFYIQVIFADSGKCLFRRITRDMASKLVRDENLEIANMPISDMNEINSFKTVTSDGLQ